MLTFLRVNSIKRVKLSFKYTEQGEKESSFVCTSYTQAQICLENYFTLTLRAISKRKTLTFRSHGSLSSERHISRTHMISLIKNKVPCKHPTVITFAIVSPPSSFLYFSSSNQGNFSIKFDDLNSA